MAMIDSGKLDQLKKSVHEFVDRLSKGDASRLKGHRLDIGAIGSEFFGPTFDSRTDLWLR